VFGDQGEEVARVLDELLTRAEHGTDRTSARVTTRTRAGRAPPTDARAAPHAPPVVDKRLDAEVIPFGVFDAPVDLVTDPTPTTGVILR
jgi:hypothetical protein